MHKDRKNEDLLSPYRVLDLTDAKGGLCVRILADLGADVIKIERPGGDEARRVGPFYKDIPHPEKSLYWFILNANKRGITLDIETEEGREIFRRLVKDADFVIESFSPGYMENLGLGYEALSKINPRIIMTTISPFGETGPKAHYKVTDLISWASGGAMYCQGDPDRPPLQLSFPQAYLHAGCEAAIGSLIAHYHRELTGEGQRVDVSIQESVIGILMDTQEMWDLQGFNFRRSGHAWTFLRPDGGHIRQAYCFPCKDGWVAFWTLGGTYTTSVKHLQECVRWADEEGMAPEWLKNFDWVHDYRTETLTQQQIDKVEGALINFLMTKTKKELYDEAFKKRMIIAPVSNAKDIWESDQLQARDFWVKVEHPELRETLTYCGPFAKMSETPMRIRCRAPLIGEHNQEIYEKELGFSKGELIMLKEAGII